MLAFWLSSTDFRAEVRLLAAGKQAVLRRPVMIFLEEKVVIDREAYNEIGGRGKRVSFFICLHRPLYFLREHSLSLASLRKQLFC